MALSVIFSSNSRLVYVALIWIDGTALAAGLLWGLTSEANGPALRVFFLGCVAVAGIYGGLTASRRILYVQALPAAVALALNCLS